MKRTITITVDVGTALPHECGDCPFAAPDYAMATFNNRLRVLCTCPAWDASGCHEVTNGRHTECIAAEGVIQKICSDWSNAMRKVAEGDVVALQRCQRCGCGVESHAVDDEERRECRDCECRQFEYDGKWC